MTSFNDSVGDHRERVRAHARASPSSSSVPAGEIALLRQVERFPYVPERPARCATSAATRPTTSRCTA